MRPVLHSEIEIAARALLAVEEGERPERMALILAMAGEADRHRLRTGRYHPEYGNGTLASAARRLPAAPARATCDVDYLDALALAARMLARDARRNWGESP